MPRRSSRPFELAPDELSLHLEDMVAVTFGDLTSEFMILPKGDSFLEYDAFRAGYEILRRSTGNFAKFNYQTVLSAAKLDSRTVIVIRTMLGVTPPEWAELARAETKSDVTQGAARVIEKRCRVESSYLNSLYTNHRSRTTLGRVEAMINVAVQQLEDGAPEKLEGFVHRLAKFDTAEGLNSLRYAAENSVPYPALLYERYLGRPLASHRDAVSELVGEVMENAIEHILRRHGVPYRKTGRTERIPTFGQAPDFCIPDETTPAVIIEAKITSDDGTARDKVARIKVLEAQRNEHINAGRPYYQVVACIDGRGFRQRREDMRQLITTLDGKVFTMATLEDLIKHTRISEYVVKVTDAGGHPSVSHNSQPLSSYTI